MTSSSVHKINSAFTQRLLPLETLAAPTRPVNPFASTGKQNPRTKMDEYDARSSVSLQQTLGTQYQGRVVSTRDDDSVKLDAYTVRENPNRETVMHATSRLKVEHTRER